MFFYDIYINTIMKEKIKLSEWTKINHNEKINNLKQIKEHN